MRVHSRCKRVAGVLGFVLTATIGVAGAAEGGKIGTPPDRLELTVGKDRTGGMQLDWLDFCPQSGTDYAVYEGHLGDYASHTSIQCSTGGATTTTVPLGTESTYFLVVPLDAGFEGSYGLDGGGSERPVGLGACLPQQIAAACLEDNFIDASPERVARLDEVMDAVAVIIESGGSYTDVATMLAGETDVEGVYSNGISMYFSVGGLSTTLYDGIAARHGGEIREIIPPPPSVLARARAREWRSPLASASHLTSDPIPASAAQLILPRGQRMVGEDDDGDGFRDLPKHALILSPWAFDFAPNDSAPLVNTILNGVLDYQKGSVTMKRNTQGLLAATMSLNDYINGWDKKDIIFISSHGDADANASWGPDPYLWLGIGGSKCSDIGAKLKAAVPDPAMRPGLYCSFVTSIGPGPNPVMGRDTLGTRAFWESVHGGNLDKKLIYMDACRTAFHPGLAEALTGTDSIFLGWSEYVLTTTSTASATAVIKETVEDGFPVLRSFARECTNGGCIDPADPNRTAAELLAGWHRADLRTREALSIPATPEYGFCAVSATLPVSVSCPSCGGGIGMSISFNISVDGLEPRDLELIEDPLDFGKYQLRLFADLDKIESGFAAPLIDQNMIPTGNGSYIDANGMVLFMDDICPNQTIEYNPWILLPAFDPNMPGNDARDRVYSWDGPFVIEIIPTVIP